MTRTKVEWVAQVSLLRPGCSGQDPFAEKTQVSKRDLGHPIEVFFERALFNGIPLKEMLL